MEILINSTSSDLPAAYQFLKDFQPLLAALLALCAAGIAFYSAQRVARLQSDTTRQLAEQQFVVAVEKENETLSRQRAAILIQTVSLLTSIIDSANGLEKLFRLCGHAFQRIPRK